MNRVNKLERELQIINFEIAMMESRIDDLAISEEHGAAEQAFRLGIKLGICIDHKYLVERQLIQLN